MKKILRGVWGFIFWNYERGTWQYDLMCALILAFIFVTPTRFFRDRPTLTEARQVVEVRGIEGTGYRIEARLLEGGSKRSVELNALQVLEQVTDRAVTIQRIEKVFDAKGNLQAYTVWIESSQE
ncbi:MAG: hypothetical protein NTZ98_05400 [Acidobacteria bacterium]|jgi:hypothetical protein|nr:hypothetical protein [Acidobacteriota bacterium]